MMSTKEWIKDVSAIVILLSGIVMAYWSFAINHGHVSESVLWYVSQCLVWSGAAFGIDVVIDHKFVKVKDYIDDALIDSKCKEGESNKDEKD